MPMSSSGRYPHGRANEGFVHVEEPHLWIRFKSTINPLIQRLLKIRALGKDPDRWKFGIERHDILESNMDSRDVAWASRGWTFREFSMASRFLAFGPSDLCFSCPDGALRMGGPAKLTKSSALKQIGPQWGKQSIDMSLVAWYRMVAEYSARHRGFSQPSDTFPALAGLASSFCASVGLPRDSYIAGLWNTPSSWHLIVGLYWVVLFVDNRQPPRPVSKFLNSLESSVVQGFHSWSWAEARAVMFDSIQQHQSQDSETHCILEAFVKHKTSSCFGELANSRVWYWALGLNRSRFTVRLDWAISETTDAERRQQRFWAIMLGSFNSVLSFGLIVHEAGPSNAGKFFRAGTFDLTNWYVERPDLFSWVCQDCEERTIDII
ncbi:hypothetical protein QBC38DRAFT_449165 [Podospora fimiseda]|uniref:Heterokaryon incompatibility domain-containing protein n=1 Tax=Podospora fimiseda TaxID=252190 RepID=A0AAN6YN73_9PEZI|nr:hypothetical protein QBC38DRAFT_449165 [Podospora fimiseda]